MKTKEKISLAFTGVLVICALTITGLVIRQEFFPPVPQPQVQQVKNWQQLELSGQRIGPTDAPVQIVEFFDYQCPFCKSVQPAVQTVQEKYPQKVSVVHEHFPLSGHVFAFGAGVAAECAGRQGAFKEYHRLLFFNQDSLGSISYSALAQEAQILNIAQFERCIGNQETAQVVTNGTNLGRRLNVSGIPTFIINGKMVSGALSEQRLDEMVQQALREANE